MHQIFDKSKINIDYQQFEPTLKSSNGRPILRILYDGIAISEAVAVPQSHGIAQIDFAFSSTLVPKDFILKSLLKNSVQELSSTYNQLSVRTNDPDVIEVLHALDFTEDSGTFVHKTNLDNAKLLADTKSQLMKMTLTSPLVGRGYVADTSSLDSLGLTLVSQEYNQIAWGLTGWARHAQIALDEKQVINDYVVGRTLEIGAGSGRVTTTLLSKATHVVASDYLPEVVANLKRSLEGVSQVDVIVEDILGPQLPDESFDCVTFWENGLGGILQREKRELAVRNMCSKLAVGGTLIIGVRTLPEAPCDHLMVATQNKKIIGVYHCFSKTELLSMLPSYMHVVELRQGDERPAGGHQIFLVARRMELNR